MDKILEVLKYIVIGLIQGIAEILPISSSGHLIIFENLFGIKENDLSFEIFLHIASLIALVIYFRKDIIDLIKGFFGYVFKRNEEDKKHFNFAIKVVIATIPAAIAGVVLKDVIETYLTSLLSVGICLLITSGIIFLSVKLNGNKKVEEISFLSTIIIGLFQMVAIIPGISRSGTTIAGGKSQKLDHKEASLFAFMLFIPISLGAFVVELKTIKDAILILNDKALLIVISFLTTLVATYLALKLIFTTIRHGKVIYFAYYCIVIGLFTIIYAIVK